MKLTSNEALKMLEDFEKNFEDNKEQVVCPQPFYPYNKVF